MKYPIGVQSFDKIREDGFVYIDKTKLIYDLAHNGTYYFLSRPRRFGKSLLISTMEAYFKGRRELFEGLAIAELEKEWKEHPVLHLDLNSRNYYERISLKDELNAHLEKWEVLYGDEKRDRSVEERFRYLIERAYEKTGRQVVILIDEYDKPILQTIDNPELQEEYRSTLKAFYSVLKTNDRYIRFAFLTGVTKFSKLSVFSDLNNLKDISMDARYVEICGITESEIEQYFQEPIHQMAAANDISYEEVCNRLKKQYDGYHFEHDTVGIYNPFSLLNALDSKVFNDYWFETATPSFLVKLLKQNDYDLSKLQTTRVTSSTIGSIDSIQTDPIPVIYQSGYLTIKGYNKEFKRYQLGFPNEEVERGFAEFLLPHYVPATKTETDMFVESFVTAVRSGRPEEFLSLIQTMLDGGDYRIQGDKEIYFHNTFYLIFKLMGFYTEVERATAMGRIDVVVQTKDYIYIMELKLDGSAEEAFRQIEEKGYALPFAQDPRKLFRIGVNFSSETRSLAEWKIS